MSRTPPSTDVVALEANAASARLALACRYSGSEDYEAEVIQVRRSAGAYGSKWPRELIWICAGGATALALIVLAV